MRKERVCFAGNYLREGELQVPNSIVNLYIERVEVQALGRKPVMKREGFITKLDEFLNVSACGLRDHARRVSAGTVKVKAELEYDYSQNLFDARPRPLDRDFERQVK